MTEPHLPADRVFLTAPFSNKDVDHARPLHVRDAGENKFNIISFTSAVIRAMYLKLTAFHRFGARRGLLNIAYSDNSKTCIALIESSFI